MKIMRKLKMDYLFVTALMLGGGLAVANARATAVNTLFYNNASAGQPANWQPVPSGRTVECNPNPNNACTETRDENGTVISSQTGNATLI
jgi:hypothetical protein